MPQGHAPPAVLVDIDGVLHVGDEPIAGAVAALDQLRELSGGLRLLTNTTSKSRGQIVEHLHELGFDVATDEVLTPAALAVGHCHEREYSSVKLLVGEAFARISRSSRMFRAAVSPTP